MIKCTLIYHEKKTAVLPDELGNLESSIINLECYLQTNIR